MSLTAAHKALLGKRILTNANHDSFSVTNPANGEILCHVHNAGSKETLKAIDAAHAAFTDWGQKPQKVRSDILKKWFALILEHTEDLAQIVTLEQGRAIKETRGEVAYGAGFVEWFAEEGRRAYGRTIPANVPGKQLVTIQQPVGVVAAITPWNFPISMITRKVAPALSAGCTVVLKPSEETPLSALALAELARQAGLPDGVLHIICTTKAAEVGEILTSDPLVKKFSFTGSTPVGKKLYAQCASTIKKISLELGGNAPVLVFDDADLDVAVAGAMLSKYRNAGQTCVCANRILVQAGIYEAFAAKLAEAVRALKLADGMDESTQIGPLINQKAVDKVDALVKDATAKGAKLTVGGGVDADQGPLFYKPTVLTGVTHDMRIFNEEIFGPVASLIKFKDEAEGIKLANDTPFGLASYAFTKDVSRAWRVGKALNYGMVGLNDGVMSTEVAPFGGVKESGIGREGAMEGLEEYMETKFLSFGAL
jgi:succinate-semialdehyde dehydrogenase/glutarate-semialdehyde dehydrogenase